MLPCPICSEQYQYLQELNDHLDSQHPKSPARYSAPQLPKRPSSQKGSFRSLSSSNPSPTPVQKVEDEPLTRSHITSLQVKRRLFSEKQQLEIARLQRRVDRLIELHLQQQGPSNKSMRSLKLEEQSIVPWQSDSEASHCVHCMKPFPAIGVVQLFHSISQSFIDGAEEQNRHHCRVCGRVVCGRSSCSMQVDIEGGSILACRSCNQMVFVRKLQAQKQEAPLYLRIYKELRQVEDVINKQLALYNADLNTLQNSTNAQIKKDQKLMNLYNHAQAQRGKLLAEFTKFDSLAKKILAQSRDTQNHQDQMVMINIYKYSNQFLQNNMFSLKLLPDLNAEPLPQEVQHLSIFRKLEPKKSFSFSNLFSPTDQPELPPRKSTLPPDPQLKSILQQQKQQVQAMISEATKARKFEDVQMLQANLKDLEDELSTHC